MKPYMSMKQCDTFWRTKGKVWFRHNSDETIGQKDIMKGARELQAKMRNRIKETENRREIKEYMSKKGIKNMIQEEE